MEIYDIGSASVGTHRDFWELWRMIEFLFATIGVDIKSAKGIYSSDGISSFYGSI